MATPTSQEPLFDIDDFYINTIQHYGDGFFDLATITERLIYDIDSFNGFIDNIIETITSIYCANLLENNHQDFLTSGGVIKLKYV